MAHGGARPGAGRPKGGLDKRTIELKAKLAELNYEPISKLVESANDTSNPQHVSARKAIFESVVPKLKAVDLNLDIDSSGIPPTELARALLGDSTSTT